MKLITKKPKLVKDVVSIAESKAKIGTIHFKPEHIEIIIQDDLELLRITLEKFNFTLYELESPEEININLQDLKNALTQAKDTAELTIELSNEKAILKIDITTEKSSRKYELRLLETEEKKMSPEVIQDKISKFSFDCKIITETSEILELINGLIIADDSESIEFICNEKYFDLKDSNVARGFSLMRLKPKEDTIINCKPNETIKARYGFEYIKKSIRMLKAPKVCIQFAQDYPIMVSSIEEGLKIDYILAPRVSND